MSRASWSCTLIFSKFWVVSRFGYTPLLVLIQPGSCTNSKLKMIIERLKHVFTTIAANLAIWLANLPLSISVHTTLLASMCRAMPFSARALKKTKKHFLWRWYCGKRKSKCGLAWSLLLSTTITRHYSFPKHFFLLFLHVERVCKSFWKESLTRTSSSFAQCSACTFKSESVFSIVNKYWQRFLSLSLILW